MPSRIARHWVVALLTLPPLPLPPPRRAAAQQLSPADRQLIVAKLWAEARTNYAYWDRVHVDWDSALTANLALAAGRPTDRQFFHALRRLVALLGDGESDLRAPGSVRARVARPPIELRAVERRPFIVDYAPNDEMRIARPERLAEVVAVQGIPVETWIRDSVLPEVGGATPIARWERAVARMLEGEKGTALHLQLRLPGGAERGASVTRAVALSDRWPLEHPALEGDTLPGGVAWVRINSGRAATGRASRARWPCSPRRARRGRPKICSSRSGTPHAVPSWASRRRAAPGRSLPYHWPRDGRSSCA